MFKLEHHVQLMLIFTGIQLCLLRCHARRLAYREKVIFGQNLFIHLLQILMYIRSVHAVGSEISVFSVSGSVRHFLCLRDHADHIHAEAINSLFAPPGHHIVHFLTYFRIIPVQIRLLFGEQVQIIHLSVLIILPCRTAKARAPVIFFFPPDIIIMVWIFLRFPALHKPSMLIRGMVYHQIHDDLQPSLMGLFQHLIEILHRTELFHDRLIIANIISVVVIRRLIHRRQPDHIDAQLLQIIQLGRNSFQISDTIPIAIHKASRIDLIHHRFFPPLSFHPVFTPFSIQIHSDFSS